MHVVCNVVVWFSDYFQDDSPPPPYSSFPPDLRDNNRQVQIVNTNWNHPVIWTSQLTKSCPFITITYISIKVIHSCIFFSEIKCAVQSFEEWILGLCNILFIYTTNERYWKWEHGMFVHVQLTTCFIQSPVNLKTLFRLSSHHSQQCRCHCCCFFCCYSLPQVLQIANSHRQWTSCNLTEKVGTFWETWNGFVCS
jgi:hypothetical protein